MTLEEEEKSRWVMALDEMLSDLEHRHTHHLQRMLFHKNRDGRLAIAQILLSALTGTAAVVSLLESTLGEIPLKITVAVLAIATTIVSGFRQNFRYNEKARRDNAAVSRCAEMSRTLAIAKYLPPVSRTQMRKEVEEILRKMDSITDAGLTQRPPTLPPIAPRPVLRGADEDTMIPGWFASKIDLCMFEDRDKSQSGDQRTRTLEQEINKT